MKSSPYKAPRKLNTSGYWSKYPSAKPWQDLSENDEPITDDEESIDAELDECLGKLEELTVKVSALEAAVSRLEAILLKESATCRSSPISSS